jgi:hypothetical protein
MMFNLEKSIAEWRQQMLAVGIQAPVPLEELDCHLREDIAQHVAAGMDEASAFEQAVRQIGEASPLRKEFMKTNSPIRTLLRKLKSFVLGAREIPLPALEQFEPAAQQTLTLAPEEARQFKHNFVGTEHLLLGLTRSGSRTVTNVLQKLGVSANLLRMEIERLVPTGPLATAAGQIPYTPRARQALQLSAEEAHRLNQSRVRPEHIFLGLLREGSGVAALVLKNLGVRLESARAEVLKEMRAHPEAG